MLRAELPVQRNRTLRGRLFMFGLVEALAHTGCRSGAQIPELRGLLKRRQLLPVYDCVTVLQEERRRGLREQTQFANAALLRQRFKSLQDQRTDARIP